MTRWWKYLRCEEKLRKPPFSAGEKETALGQPSSTYEEIIEEMEPGFLRWYKQA